LSSKIAKQENVEDQELVQLAALLHDVRDYKYSGSETEGPDAAAAFLETQNYPKEKIQKIRQIIEGISFKNELKSSPLQLREKFPELAIVQDADRLDAIGAIGIGRAFTYSGKRGRAMYDPTKPPKQNITKEQYMTQGSVDNTTLNHFYEKLLLLKGMMKTESGRQMAEQRHRFMEQFLNEFYLEWEGST